MTGRLKLLIVGLAIAVLLLAVFWRPYRSSKPAAVPSLAEAREQLEAGYSARKAGDNAGATKSFARAEKLSLRILSTNPKNGGANFVAGVALTQQKRFVAAIAHYDAIDDSDSEHVVPARNGAGEILRHTGQWIEAERRFRATLAQDANNLLAHQRLAYMLDLQGRRWDARPHLLALVRQGQATLEELLLLGSGAIVLELTDHLEEVHALAPSDPSPLLGLARIALKHGRLKEAQELLVRVTNSSVALLPQAKAESQAAIGAVLLAEGNEDELIRWQHALDDTARRHPDVWVVQASVARRKNEMKVAARCYWEAVRLDPNHLAAHYQLAQVLTALDQDDAAQRFADRAKLLQIWSHTLNKINDNHENVSAMRAAAETAEALGRAWEAVSWRMVALEFDPSRNNPQLDWARIGIEERIKKLGASTPQTIASSYLASQFPLSNYPLPDWSEASPVVVQVGSKNQSAVTFVDDAKSVGINFQYSSGVKPLQSGRPVYSFLGGGVAVLDYDGNGCPDLFFPQACHWPPDPNQREHLDGLFRNLGNGKFEDVTSSTRLVEERFGHGATVGDFDSDGFPDIYVANIGVNRLFRNNGDGTFSDVTVEAGIDQEAWTTSCLMADVNGDGHPDLYDVNYVQGKNIYETVWQKDDHGRIGKIGEPQPDRFFLNAGDGTFRDATAAAGLDIAGGNGLGIVACDFDGSRRLSLFVANDADANFLLFNKTPSRGQSPQFSERALQSGVAYDDLGQAQGCMGVAVGDADGNGSLDLFVTNFYQEYYTLYLKQSTEVFQDDTRAAGLFQPTYLLLGFGTQFIDGELDGWPDLVVTNGHVDDYTHVGANYQMRPQYFHNQGRGRFRESRAKTLGPYFADKYLGRGMARLDWNRDGRPDVVITHLDHPASLLTNTTREVGHFVAIQLRGVECSRDAIGATVIVRTKDRSWTQQLTAGDGFLSSNQRELIFGLGEQSEVTEVEVHWPWGKSQIFDNVGVDQRWLVVQHRLKAVKLLKR